MSEDVLKSNQFAFSGTDGYANVPDEPEIRPKRKIILKDVSVLPVVRLAFYGYVATIPFETLDIGVPIEITVISLGVLLLALLFQITLCLRRPPLAYWCFFFYGVIFALPMVLQRTSFQGEMLWQLMILIQLILMSWIAFNVMKSEKVAHTAMIVFALSCALLATLQVTGVANRTTNFEESIQRTTALGFHPNTLARMFALAVLVLIGFTYGARKKLFKSPYLLWAILAVFGVAIIQTGSRGGLLALAAGLLVFALRTGSLWVKVRNGLLVLIGIAFFGFLAMQSDVTRARFERALDDGDLARRDQIFPLAWQMFTEKPILGWGGKTSEYELGTRIGHIEETKKNPHNLILYTLVATGLVGTIPMMVGIGLAFAAAWKARHGPRGVLPLSLLVTVMVANMSGVWLHNKMHWLVMAYALSSIGVLVVRRVPRFEAGPPLTAGSHSVAAH